MMRLHGTASENYQGSSTSKREIPRLKSLLNGPSIIFKSIFFKDIISPCKILWTPPKATSKRSTEYAKELIHAVERKVNCREETSIRLEKKRIRNEDIFIRARNIPKYCPLWENTLSHYLKPKKRFHGVQVVGPKVYVIKVDLETINFPPFNYNIFNPHLTGRLNIQGFSDTGEDVTTYFEGYSIENDKLGFLSSNWEDHPCLEDLTADDIVDIFHWLKLKPFRRILNKKPVNKRWSKLPLRVLKDIVNETEYQNDGRYVFMKWKERFVIDHAVDDEPVAGITYRGFYYIVHDKFTGEIEGFYHERGTAAFQRLS